MGVIINPYRYAAGGGDPSFSSVVLLSHFDGSDGSTTFTDVIGHTLTANGNAQLDTAQFKWGSASLLLDGTGDYVSVADSDEWTPAGDYTIEAWIRFNGSPSGVQAVISHYLNTGNQRAWLIRYDATTGNLQFQTFRNTGAGNSTPDTKEASWSPSADTWYHVAAVRSGTTDKLYADGNRLIESTATTGPINSTAVLAIGAINSSGFTQFFNGWIDDVRITKGVARYTGATYTIPTAAFPDS